MKVTALGVIRLASTARRKVRETAERRRGVSEWVAVPMAGPRGAGVGGG
jgi:hypothetical protein